MRKSNDVDLVPVYIKFANVTFAKFDEAKL
ncbi:MAG: hypothetical protein UY52_C0012G0014 [Parcubacteria group bacterium GW2011_GWC2_49_9]|nr:MAG: hypothetical protein UY34_C0023G0004 [Parcubacteria group bacterium GW2011_GWA2_48_9]KKW15927.1 MAG: hypothetical protein UY52_C0012G0014 [Parcubacteria group bacterium GW2011_GWC2_49_9]